MSGKKDQGHVNGRMREILMLESYDPATRGRDTRERGDKKGRERAEGAESISHEEGR